MESKKYRRKTWAKFKPHFGTAHQELKDVSDKIVVDAGFQSAHLVAQVVEGLSKVFQTTDYDNEDTLFQMANAISHFSYYYSSRTASMSRWRANSKAVVFHTLYRGQIDARLFP